MPGRPGSDLGWFSGSAEIRRTRRAGKSRRSQHISLWSVEYPELTVPEVCVTTSRGFTSAVARNLARRRTRGCIIDLRSDLEPGKRHLVECHPGTEKVDYQKLVMEIRELISGKNQ